MNYELVKLQEREDEKTHKQSAIELLKAIESLKAMAAAPKGVPKTCATWHGTIGQHNIRRVEHQTALEGLNHGTKSIFFQGIRNCLEGMENPWWDAKRNLWGTLDSERGPALWFVNE